MSNPQVKTILPEAMLGKKVMYGMKGTDRLVAYQADRSSYSGGESIKLGISQTDYLLPRSSFFQFKAAVTGTGSPCFKQNIASIVRRLRVVVGGKDIELIDRYDQLHQILEIVQDEADYDPVVANVSYPKPSRKWEQGVGTLAERQGWAAERLYTMKLYSGFLTLDKLIPLYKLGDKIRIEIDLATDSQACLGTTATYTITDFKFMGHMVTMPSAYNASVEQEIATNGIEYLFPSFDYQSVKMSSSSNSILLSCKRRSMKFLLGVFRNTANESILTADVEFIRSKLTDYQLQTSSGNVNPAQPLLVGAPSLMEVRRCLGKINGNADKLDQLTYAQYAVEATAKRFMLGMELESFIAQDVLTGTDGLAEDLILQLKHSAAVDDNIYAHIYCAYDVTFRIGAGFVHELKQ